MNKLILKILKNNSRCVILGLLLFSGFFSASTYWIGIHQGKNLSSNIHNNKSSNIDIILEHLLNNYVDTLEKIELSENNSYFLIYSKGRLQKECVSFSSYLIAA